MSYTYTTFQTALAIEMAVPNNNPNDPQFVAVLQTLIDQAEQRCYRDLDLLAATSSQTLPLTIGASKLDFSSLSPNLLILEDVNIVVPPTVTNPELGERVPAYPVSKEWLRMTFGVSGVRGIPTFYAMNDDRTILLGPFPDAAYTAELVGKYRPTPLYLQAPANGTQTTFLTSLLPDLFLAAAMCAGSAYQHNWGAQSDDPRQAMSWESNYQGLLGPAKSEEARKKYHGWMSMTSEMPTQPPTGPQ
jgi:hypothetical protein